ncbi:MAG TPA: redoxin domain-containing protein [Fimbriimonas sp.]|nr:redoxin domain-containing protein [Fimbriimonas sp.]
MNLYRRLFTALVFAAALSAIPQVGQRMNVKAPEFVGGTWLNTDKPLDLESLRGKVVLVHFWTLDCINCQHNLPYINKWQKQFGEDKDFQIVSIHTPEMESEKEPLRLKEAIKKWGIEYPVLVDNDHRNWERWHQDCWPTVYLVDKKGKIWGGWRGELEYRNAGGFAKLTSGIKELLAEK